MPAGAPLPFIFLDLNTLEDFFGAQGAVAAVNRETARPKIKELAYLIMHAGLVSLAGVDLHAPSDPEFAQFNLPPHGLDRSPGRQKIFETFVRGAAVIPPSGKRRPWPNMTELRQRGGQLILEKSQFDLFSNPALHETLKNFQPRELILYGAILEQDIFYTACAARNFLYTVTIAEDACGIRDKAAAEQARAGMLLRGVTFECTEEILSRVARATRQAGLAQPVPTDPSKKK
ncbi:MAG: isochorismatase family protein [Planctomycetes bacterium]|nr:isochorismatase family protein [Planctomycetota bacterium]